MTDKLDQLTRIFTEAVERGDVAHDVAETLLSRVLEIDVDMMLDLAAAQHEVRRLQEQRDATRIYLGVALSNNEDENGDDSPEAALREEVRRILNDVGIDKKIACIKELRCSDKATKAWAELGNNPSPASGGPHPAGWVPRALGLKESKDIIDAAQTGRLWLGVKGYANL